MKEELRRNVFNFEINEAHKPDNPDIAIRKILSWVYDFRLDFSILFIFFIKKV